jgi:hypothetical protein
MLIFRSLLNVADVDSARVRSTAAPAGIKFDLRGKALQVRTSPALAICGVVFENHFSNKSLMYLITKSGLSLCM